MDNDENKKDILLISRIVLAAIIIGISLVTIHQFFNKSGFILPVIWSLGFLFLGGLFGFLYGMPRILFADEKINSTPTGNNAEQSKNSNGLSYQVSSHLERILEWLTTLIVGLTLVQWNSVVLGFNSIARFISEGMNPDSPFVNQSFAASIMLYFPIIGFLGAYLITRIYLSRVFEDNDVGRRLEINEVEKYEINKFDLSNIQNTSLNANLGNTLNKALSVNKNIQKLSKDTADKILSFPLQNLTSLEDTISWSKTQLATGNYEKAAEGYKKAVEITPTDVQLRLEYVNSLYHAGIFTNDISQQQKFRAESEANLLVAYGLLNSSTEPDLRMKIFRAITFFYLYSDPPKGFENTIKYGEEFVNDPDPKKIQSGGILVNLACAYGQKYKWLKEQNASESSLEEAKTNAFKFMSMALEIDKNDIWLNRLRTLIQSGVSKDPSDNDLEIFENDNKFRQTVGLPTLIALPDISTDAGIISRLLLAECRGPAFADYVEAEAVSAMKAMRATVENRKQKPNLFLAAGNTTLNIVTAPPGAVDDPRRQFAGFYLGDDGKLKLSTAIQTNIDAIVARANSGTPGKYAAFVNNAIAVAQGAIDDPFIGLTEINGVPVKKGTFGWRPEGNPISGPLFVKIPTQQSGVILKTQFYALKASAF